MMNVENFITAVFVRKSLWDQTDPNHHNRYVLDKLWSEIEKEFDVSKNMARNKWKSLRDKFRKVQAQIPDKRSGDAGVGTPKPQSWPYYESLLFLKDQFTPRRSSGNIESMLTLDELEEDAMAKSNDEADCTDDLSNVSLVLPPNNSSSEGSQKRLSTSNFASSGEIKKRNRQSDIVVQKLIDIEKEKIEYLHEKNKKKTIKDDDMSFFESLLPYVKQFSHMDKMAFRIKVMQIIQQMMPRINDRVYGHGAPQTATHADITDIFSGNDTNQSASASAWEQRNLY